MDTNALKIFAQKARRQLIQIVSAKLKTVLTTDSVEIREKAFAIKKLREQIKQFSEEQVIEQVAYTWFNRFCALRYMDVKGYSFIGTVSPSEGNTQPELLQEAKQGHIDANLEKYVNKSYIFNLLSGHTKSSDPQGEAYKLLVVAVCNYYYNVMPFMFEKIADYTELLIPDDLLSSSSILSSLREAMSPENCQDVEVIGWLYQFYISEKKDEVFEGLKKNKKITPENIPAATQLFTPHWIVRYLVENSLGRLWMLNKPNSKLVDKMDYYIKPEEDESDFIKLNSPEEIKVCDPACGSGHILVYAFELLYSIYEEEGYNPVDISKLILEKNLYGIEIDERAGELASFSLFIKGVEKDKRFFNRNIQPNICVLENVSFSDDDFKNYVKVAGDDLLSYNVKELFQQFKLAKNFGSLINPVNPSKDAGTLLNLDTPNYLEIYKKLSNKDFSDDIFIDQIHKGVLNTLKQTSYLSSKYHVVVANPPYMGGGGFNIELTNYAKKEYPDTKSDLFAMFIERGFQFTKEKGYNAMVTMQSWMFLSSYEKFRSVLFNKVTINCMVHMANMVMGIAFGTAATVWKNFLYPDLKGHFSYVNLEDLNDKRIPKEFPIKNNRLTTASASDFKKIPGSPIAYWVSDKVREVFGESQKLGEFCEARMGLSTGNNDKFVRLWYECNYSSISFNVQNRAEAQKTGNRWFPYSKGGQFRKWYGNNEFVVDWYNDGYEVRNTLHPSGKRIWAHNFNLEHIFRSSITWNLITSGDISVKLNQTGFLFDTTGNCAFFNKDEYKIVSMGLLNSNIGKYYSNILNPTLAFTPGNFFNIPFRESLIRDDFIININELVRISKQDWDFYEYSWDFTISPLIMVYSKGINLSTAFKLLVSKYYDYRLNTVKLEEENNLILNEIYKLDSAINSDVPLKEITLTCNPHYRYGGNKTEEELETLLLADTMKEFISYAVGCMFGRYSIDKPGLILANQGETLEDYLKQVSKPSFMPDEDNVIPLLEDEWFPDDVTERFKIFLKVTFGEENFDENLKFIESAIGKNIRNFFTKDFYDYHVKMYKKRPIYWLFSSPKGSFNVLIYMHRYRPDTVGVILNDYLREYRTKLTSHITKLENLSGSSSASQKDKAKALKDIEKYKKVVEELNLYEKDILYPLATQKIEIDLDDGVKVNYTKFGKALKKIAGLEEKGED